MEFGDHFSLILSWKNEASVAEGHFEPDDLVYETSGDIFGSDETEVSELVGTFRFYYVDVVRAINSRESIFFVLDAHSEEILEYHEPIFDSESNDFSDQVRDLFDHEISYQNLLILDRLEILPKYRGKRFGLSIMRYLIERFSSGAGIVAIKPFPLQFEYKPTGEADTRWRNKMNLDQYSTNKKATTKKLHKYYSELGFKQLRGAKIMALSTDFVLPSIKNKYLL